MRANTREIRPLTGVRGAAALFVVCHHLFYFHPQSAILDHNVLGRGYLSVDLFFILSGLVMAMTYSSSMAAGVTDQKYLRFLKNRVARVYPLYIALLLFILLPACAHFILKHGAFPSGWSLKGVIANLLLVQNWGFGASVIGPSWSLSTEVAAYFLFPVLFALAFHASRLVPWLTSIACGALLCLASTGHHTPVLDGWHGYLDVSEGTEFQPLLRCVAGFTFGILGFRAASVPFIKSLISFDITFIAALLATIAALYFGLHDLVVYAGLFLLVLCCYGDSKASNALFGNRVVHFLGVVSYSIYLVHVFFMRYIPALDIFAKLHFGSAASVIYHLAPLLGITGVAYCLYRFIEVPGRHYAKMLLKLHPTVLKASME